MALNFNGATHKVVVTDVAAIRDQATWTLLGWFRPTLLDANFRTMMAKTSNMFVTVSNTGSFGGAGSLRIKRNYSGANLDYFSGNVFTLNEWNFFAAVLENVATASANEFAQLYVGNRTTPADEVTYTTRNDPSGTITGDTGDLNIGQFGSNNLNFQGDVANLRFSTAAMSRGRIRNQQWRLRPRGATQFYFQLGWTGTTTVTDWTGKGNSGAITGATVVPHVPLGSPFGFESREVFVAAPAPTGNMLGILQQHNQYTGGGLAI